MQKCVWVSPWSHTSHYQPLLLEALPPGRGRALEVGCGEGDFSRLLAGRFDQVDAVDADAEAIRGARGLTEATNVRFHASDFMGWPVEPGAYDFVCALASLHHLPFGRALSRMTAALKPGGVLAIIGLWRETTLLDFARSVVAFPVSRVLALTHRRKRSLGRGPMRVREPMMSLGEIRSRAALLLPGARLRRHLLWRYTLLWTRPVG